MSKELNFPIQKSHWFLLLFLAIIFSSCGKNITFPVSSAVPAAKGSVKVTTDQNNNYETRVQVRHLAPPERLSPPRKVYVVWMDTEQSRTNHVGQLRTKSKMFSRSYNAELKTVSSHKPTRVFVTAEDVAEIQYPSSQVVLDTQNF
jgi:hypothetical protein